MYSLGDAIVEIPDIYVFNASSCVLAAAGRRAPDTQGGRRRARATHTSDLVVAALDRAGPHVRSSVRG
jgi:hypothetical protein